MAQKTQPQQCHTSSKAHSLKDYAGKCPNKNNSVQTLTSSLRLRANLFLTRHTENVCRAEAGSPMRNHSATSMIWAAPWHTMDARTGSRMHAARGQSAPSLTYSWTFSVMRGTFLDCAGATQTGNTPPRNWHRTSGTVKTPDEDSEEPSMFEKAVDGRRCGAQNRKDPLFRIGARIGPTSSDALASLACAPGLGTKVVRNFQLPT